MKKILFILKGFLLACLFVCLQIITTSFLPYPFSTIHISLILLIFTMIVYRRGTIVWLAFFVGFLFDVYSNNTFGIYISVFSISCLFTYWLYRDVFTAQSIWAILVLMAIALVTFRLSFSLILYMTDVVIWKDIYSFLFYEFVNTLICAFVIYFVGGIYKYTKPLGK